MALLNDRCLCLRKVEYSETSQILTLFGRRLGVFRAIAKGAHRRTKAGASKFDGGVDLLDLGEGTMTDPAEKDLATLTEWKLVDGHLDLRKDQRALYLALYAAELAGRLTHENDPQPRIFDLLNWLLMNLPTRRLEECFVAFELELLRESGFMPEVNNCVVCGDPIGGEGRVSFSPNAGGVVCGRCAAPPGPKISVEARLLRIIQTLLKLPRQEGIPQRLPILTRAQTDPVNRLLADYIRSILGHDLRVVPYVL